MAESRAHNPVDPRARGARRRRSCPAEELKKHLPGVEPERRLNDWGRSERIEGIFDSTLVDFFYRYWFRAEVEGIENVPVDAAARCSSRTTAARCRPTRR